MKGKHKNIFKSLLALMLAFIMLLGAAPLSALAGVDFASIFAPKAEAADGDNTEKHVDGYYTYIVENGTANIVNCDESISGDITIPDELGGYPVTAISGNAFCNCKNIATIIISKNVTKINDLAFFGMLNLTSIAVSPDNPRYMSKDGVLYKGEMRELIQYPIASKRSSFTIPNGVEKIVGGAFSLSNLKNIIISDSVTYIGYCAFSYCTSITDITIPDSVTKLGMMLFWGCENLKNVTVGKGVDIENISSSSFMDCKNLSNITVSIESKTLSSEDGVLFNRDKTELILYPLGNKRTDYSIPNNVKTIGPSAFSNSVNLTNITIPDSVTSIEDSAFYRCSSLESVTVGNSVISIGDSAFQSCNSLESVTIPDSVISIGWYAFKDCRILASVTIGNSVASIGDEAFFGCSSLMSINVTSYNNYYSDENGVLFNKEKTELIQYPIGKSEIAYIIPDRVTSIENHAFYSCSSLKSVTIPDSVTSIGAYAFYECSSLEDVYYSGSKTEWEAIYIGYDNEYLQNATIHYNYTGEHICTEKKLVTIAPQCEVNGMSYYICLDCGKVIGEKTVIPATGHSWGEWVVTKAATTTSEGSRERICSACKKKETEIIPILAQTVKDDKSGVEISAPSGSYNGELELEVEEIFDGESFQIVGAIDGNEQSKVYDVTTKIDGKATQPGAAVTVRIPLPDGYDASRTYVYHVNSETGEVENMNARYEDGYLVFETDHFSVYAIVEIKAPKKDSIFKKIFNIILAPFRAIINLFKKLLGK